jgi:hypothetical protein
MARKRNVDAENHLLTGGLLTGFLTFMGFGPGAVAGAAITGAMVAKDVSKAKKEEAFKRDFESYQQMRERLDKEWYEIEMLLRNMEYFSPTKKDYLDQVELENAFKNARVVEDYEYNDKDFSFVWSAEEMAKKANATDDQYKIVHRKYGNVLRYAIEKDGKCTVTGFRLKYPEHFREKCAKAGIPFKSHGYCELYDLKQKLHAKHYEGSNFNFSRYH